MIANEPKKPFADLEIIEEVAKEELGRFKKALAKASNKYFDRESERLSAKEGKDLWLKITRANTLITFIADDAMETLFTVVNDPGYERRPWDAHLNGVRTLTRTTPQGYALSMLAKVLHLEETTSKVASLITRSTEVQCDIYKVAQVAKTFIDHYEWAKRHAEKFGTPNDELIRKYANLKTWGREEEFTQFSAVAEKASMGVIEVFIEGPIKLYLMISPEQMMLVIQGLTFRTAFDFENGGRNGLEDSLSLLTNAQKAVEVSPLFKIVRELLAEGVKEYYASWKSEHQEIRESVLDEDRAKRFVECFENGSLFVKQ